jgi:type IV secretory pathway protease TraF
MARKGVMRFLRALAVLIVGTAAGVCAITGYMLQASTTSGLGWTIVPMQSVPARLILGAGALIAIPVGALLTHKRQ